MPTHWLRVVPFPQRLKAAHLLTLSVSGPLQAKLYPAAPLQADEWLSTEILRAAGDPGAIGVFRSVFYLPKPRPLNYLVNDLFRKPTLVLSGKDDPLADKVKQTQAICRSCSNATAVLLAAGHCPFDEVPELVNAELLHFMEDRVLPAMQGKRKQLQIANT